MNSKTIAIATALSVSALTSLSAPSAALASTGKTQQINDDTRVRYRTVDVDGIKIFYREAGDPKKPTLLLLHGFPSSSHMYRDLIPLLAGDFHLIAPDYPGAGFSEAPSPDRFTPTFESLADVMADFTQRLGLSKFTIYMQDFGGPVGFRIAVKHPGWISGLIIQNSNAYEEGIAPEQLQGMKDRSGNLSQQQKDEAGKAVSRGATEYFYKTGARDFAAMNPDAWNFDSWLLDNPDIKRIQTALIIDYYSNVLQYPRWQEYMRAHQPKTLIVWGKNDEFFIPKGAEAYRRDLPKAELHYFDTGHFALEEDAPEIARDIRRFFGRGK